MKKECFTILAHSAKVNKKQEQRKATKSFNLYAIISLTSLTQKLKSQDKTKSLSSRNNTYPETFLIGVCFWLIWEMGFPNLKLKSQDPEMFLIEVCFWFEVSEETKVWVREKVIGVCFWFDLGKRARERTN